MKTGLTIQQMAQELLRQSKAKQDYLVNTGSLSLSVTTDAPQLRVTENGLDIRLRIRRLTTPLMHFGQDCCCTTCFSLRMKSRLFWSATVCTAAVWQKPRGGKA